MHLKVILETGELETYDNVRRASVLAMAAGADFIKTSTGKVTPAATLPVTLVMLEAIRDSSSSGPAATRTRTTSRSTDHAGGPGRGRGIRRFATRAFLGRVARQSQEPSVALTTADAARRAEVDDSLLPCQNGFVTISTTMAPTRPRVTKVRRWLARARSA